MCVVKDAVHGSMYEDSERDDSMICVLLKVLCTAVCVKKSCE